MSISSASPLMAAAAKGFCSTAGAGFNGGSSRGRGVCGGASCCQTLTRNSRRAISVAAGSGGVRGEAGGRCPSSAGRTTSCGTGVSGRRRGKSAGRMRSGARTPLPISAPGLDCWAAGGRVTSGSRGARGVLAWRFGSAGGSSEGRSGLFSGALVVALPACSCSRRN